MHSTLVTPLVLDRKEAAEVLRISLRKLDYLLERGDLRPTRIDGRVLVAWTELNRFVREKTARRKQTNQQQLTV